MLRKRIVFALLWQKGTFCLSRNFKLQSVGDAAWLERHYNFRVIASAIDELIVLNVTRGDKEMERFANDLATVSRGVFVPIAAGGGVRSHEDARRVMQAGADKLVVNTPIITQPDLVSSLARLYGRQCLVGSIDYRGPAGSGRVATGNGAEPTDFTVNQAIGLAERAGVGEIYLTSIDRDGTGQGYDTETLVEATETAKVPIIASGGVGNHNHLADWLLRPGASAASTAHLFNFVGGGLAEARRRCGELGVRLGEWPLEWKG